MGLKKIIIADEQSGEVLDTLYTDEAVKCIIDTLNGDNPWGISVFTTKEDYNEAASGDDAV